MSRTRPFKKTTRLRRPDSDAAAYGFNSHFLGECHSRVRCAGGDEKDAARFHCADRLLQIWIGSLLGPCARALKFEIDVLE